MKRINKLNESIQNLITKYISDAAEGHMLIRKINMQIVQGGVERIAWHIWGWKTTHIIYPWYMMALVHVNRRWKYAFQTPGGWPLTFCMCHVCALPVRTWLFDLLFPEAWCTSLQRHGTSTRNASITAACTGRKPAAWPQSDLVLALGVFLVIMSMHFFFSLPACVIQHRLYYLKTSRIKTQ